MDFFKTEHPHVEAGNALTTALRDWLGRPTLLMVSGGSALSLLDMVDPSVLGPHVTLTVLDERFSTDPAVNNFSQLTQTQFYQSGSKKGIATIATEVVDGESREAFTERFVLALHTWKVQHQDGVVLATMGIGPDGHTAGILPGEHNVDFNGDDWVVSYSVPKTVNQYTDRVTVTNTFLRQEIDEVIVLVTGESKQEIINELYYSAKHNNTLSGKPMDILLELKHVSLYTDLLQ